MTKDEARSLAGAELKAHFPGLTPGQARVLADKFAALWATFGTDAKPIDGEVLGKLQSFIQLDPTLARRVPTPREVAQHMTRDVTDLLQRATIGHSANSLDPDQRLAACPADSAVLVPAQELKTPTAGSPSGMPRLVQDWSDKQVLEYMAKEHGVDTAGMFATQRRDLIAFARRNVLPQVTRYDSDTNVMIGEHVDRDARARGQVLTDRIAAAKKIAATTGSPVEQAAALRQTADLQRQMGSDGSAALSPTERLTSARLASAKTEGK